jgi:hypothetical protein
MFKRLMPFVLVSVCALPLAIASPSGRGPSAATRDGQVGVADTHSPDFSDLTALTDQDREAFQLAQREADPQLGEQRGGFLGFVVLVLLIVLIVILVD